MFIQFLKRPSAKMEEVYKYQSKYNRFCDEYPDLRSDQQVKEEFYNDAIDISDRIWEIIVKRKNEAIEERLRIMSSGWIELEMEKFYSHLEQIILAEVERFSKSLTIIREFFLVLDSKIGFLRDSRFSTLNFIKNKDIVMDVGSLPLESENKAKGNYPRLNKLFNNCVKILFIYDDIIADIEALQKTITPVLSKKMLARSNTLKKKIEKSSADVLSAHAHNEDIFIYEDDIKNSIKSEKAKFKYRVTMIKYWGVNKLDNLRNIANIAFEKLDEWIISTIKAENDAMNFVVNKLRRNVDLERKFKISAELDVFDIYTPVDFNSSSNSNSDGKKHTYNYKNVNDNCLFNLYKFKSVNEELRLYEVQNNYIRISMFIEVFVKKYIVDSSDSCLPQSLRMLSFHNYSKFMKHFEVSTPPERAYSSNNNNNNNNENITNKESADLDNENINKENIILENEKEREKETKSGFDSKAETAKDGIKSETKISHFTGMSSGSGNINPNTNNMNNMNNANSASNVNIHNSSRHGNRNEYLNLRDISTIILLMHCRVLDANSEAALRVKIEPMVINNTLISREDFLNLEFWFEKDVFMNNMLEEESELYEKSKKIVAKEVLFEIFKNVSIVI